MIYITPEQIKEYVSKNPEGIAGMSKELSEMVNHFAERVVNECIQVCKIRVGNSDYNTGRMHCASDIAEYFGMRTPGSYEPKMSELKNESF